MLRLFHQSLMLWGYLCNKRWLPLSPIAERYFSPLSKGPRAAVPPPLQKDKDERGDSRAIIKIFGYCWTMTRNVKNGEHPLRLPYIQLDLKADSACTRSAIFATVMGRLQQQTSINYRYYYLFACTSCDSFSSRSLSIISFFYPYSAQRSIERLCCLFL